MSGDLAIAQSTPVQQPAAASHIPAASTASSAAPDPVAAAAASKRPLTNPSLHIDVALNLVVLQFVDDNGNVTSSIPSAKQLKAYQQNGSDAALPKAVTKVK